MPAGAVPKDGPSAGVTMATAIASLVRGEPVADDVGMTGEITLTGQVLPIGGIREKSLAAQRAGLKRVILPRENEPDLDELPPETRDAIEFIPADTIEDVFAAAFDGKPPSPPARRPQADRAPGGEGRLAKREARDEAGRRRPSRTSDVRRQSSWILALAAQHERVLVDVVADASRRSVCELHPAGGHDVCCPSSVPPVCCAIGFMRSVELVSRRWRRARRV